jgi:predicted nucleic acid-binding protein
LANEEIDFVTRFEAELIYQTMRGQKDISRAEMKTFVEAARLSYGEIGYSQAIIAVASACRIMGKDRDCLEFLHSALEHAQAHKLHARIPAIILAEVRLHVAAEDFTSARDAISRGRLYAIPVDDRVTRPEWQFFEARIALEDSTLREAEATASAIEIVPQTDSVARRAGCLAVILRLRLKQQTSPAVLKSLVAELEEAHMITREIGAQDFEAHTLYLGLSAVGENEKARRLLQDYVGHVRRSRRPLSSSIRALVLENGETSRK